MITNTQFLMYLYFYYSFTNMSMNFLLVLVNHLFWNGSFLLDE
jgi:hypothetical protein